MLDVAGGDKGREKIAGSCDDPAAAAVVPNFGKFELVDGLPNAGDWLGPKPAVVAADGWPDPKEKGNGLLAAADAAWLVPPKAMFEPEAKAAVVPVESG